MNYYQDNYEQTNHELVNATNRAADATHRAARAAEEQAAIQRKQLHLEQLRHEFDKEVQRATDLGLTHQEYVRRKADAAYAAEKLNNARADEALCLKLVSKEQWWARRKASVEVLKLCFRNWKNFVKSPKITWNLLRPYKNSIRQQTIGSFANSPAQQRLSLARASESQALIAYTNAAALL